MPVVGIEELHLVGGDAVNEPVVVVTGDRDHRQDLPGLRIHRDAYGLREPVLLDPLAQLSVEELLQAVVDGEHDAVAGDRR